MSAPQEAGGRRLSLDAFRGLVMLATASGALSLCQAAEFPTCSRPSLVQFLGACAIRGGYWIFFALYPLPRPDFNYALVGVRPDFSKLDGFLFHWAKNTNAAADFDCWFLNLFPHPEGEPFLFSEG